MKRLALLTLCGPMLLGTAACSSKVCAAQVRGQTKIEVYGTAGSGAQAAAAGAQTINSVSLQSSQQAASAPDPQRSGASQADPASSSDNGNASDAVDVAAQNPPVESQVVPPQTPPEETVDVDHNDEDC